jgi:hypothetical protein
MFYPHKRAIFRTNISSNLLGENCTDGKGSEHELRPQTKSPDSTLPGLCLKQHLRERLGDQGRPGFPFDFAGVAGYE